MPSETKIGSAYRMKARPASCIVAFVSKVPLLTGADLYFLKHITPAAMWSVP